MTLRRLLCLAAAAVSIPSLLTLAAWKNQKEANAAAAPGPPGTDGSPAWLRARGKQEAQLAAVSPAFHDFHFTDRIAQSGITFSSHVVEDAAKNYKAVHYDHGFGIAAADVDGDGLPDLYFATQLGTNQLWKNLGNGKFRDITKSAGVDMPDAISVGASFADVDNDGKPDLFVATVRHGNRLFHNLGGGRFEDITSRSGLGYSGHSSGATFFDYDGDGLLDLFVANVGRYTSDRKLADGHYEGLADAFHGHTHPDRAETSILYHNLGGGRFEDVTRKMHLADASWSGDAVVLDVNDDGFPDLYVLDMQGRNHLWLNEAGKSFRDATTSYFAKTPWGAMGAKVFDFDGDASLDLYITDMHSDMFDNLPPGSWDAEARKSDPMKMPADLFPEGKQPFVFGNALFTRGAKSTRAYADVSDRLGVETYWPWGPSVDDLNADGWDDIFVANSMNFPFRYAPNSILLNEAGKHFLPAEFTLGVEPRATGWTEWFKLDCAGPDSNNRECGVCNGPSASDVGCRQTSPEHFTVMGARGTRSAAIVDLDNDGDLDIVTNEFNAAPMVLVSDLSAKKKINWLKVQLVGARSNREGLGAQVTVVLPSGRRILKVMDGKSGYLSMSDLPLYFGLGEATRVSSIEVKWPSKRKQFVAGPIAAGQLRQIVER